MLKVMLNRTSRPVTGPSPPVNWVGSGLMPLTTELAAVNGKPLLSNVVVKLSWPSLLSDAAKLLSDGEFVRVSTRPSGGKVESMGNT